MSRSAVNTGNYVVDLVDIGSHQIFNTSSGNLTCTLPSAVNARVGFSVKITHDPASIGTDSLTIIRNGSDVIQNVDGNLVIPKGTSIFLESNGVDGWIGFRPIDSDLMGVPNGVATLDGTGKINSDQINGDYQDITDGTTFVDLSSKIIPSPVLLIRTTGYYEAGDGGGAAYRRVESEPSHIFKAQSGDDAWWEYVPDGGIVLLPQIGVFPTVYSPDTYHTEGVLEPEAREIFDDAPSDHKPGWYTLWQISKLIQRLRTTGQTGTGTKFWTLIGGAAGLSWEEVDGSWQLVVSDPGTLPDVDPDEEEDEEEEEEEEEVGEENDDDVLSAPDPLRFNTIKTAYYEAVSAIGTDLVITAGEMDAAPTTTALENYTRLQAAAEWAAGRFKIYTPGSHGVYNVRGEIKLPSFSSWAGDHERSIFRMANDTARSLNNFTNESNDRTEANVGNQKICIIGLSADGNTANRTGDNGSSTSGNCFGWANVKDMDAQFLWGFDAPKHCHDIAGSTYNATNTTVVGAADNGSGLIRLTVGSTTRFETGDRCVVRGVQGTTEANSPAPLFWTITVIDGTHVDLQDSTFTNAFTSSPGAYMLREATQDELSAGWTSGVFNRLKGNFAGDDLITTHHCQHVTLYSPHSEFNVNFDNGNGLEIDDGSRFVTVFDLFARMCTNGLEIKAHGRSVAPFHIRIYGVTAVSNRSTALDFHHSSPWNASRPSPTAENVVIRDAIVKDTRTSALVATDYSGWTVDGLTIIDPPTDPIAIAALIYVRRGVERGILNNVRAVGYSHVTSLIACTSWRAGGNIRFSNIVSINSAKKRVLYIGDSPRHVTVENIEGVAEVGKITLSTDASVVEFNNTPGPINGTVRGIRNTGYNHFLDAGALGYFDYDVEMSPRPIYRGGLAGPQDDTYNYYRDTIAVPARSALGLTTTPRYGRRMAVREGSQNMGIGEGLIDAHGLWAENNTIYDWTQTRSHKLTSTDSNIAAEFQNWTVGIGDSNVLQQRTAWGTYSRVFGTFGVGFNGLSSSDLGGWLALTGSTTARASIRLYDGVDPTAPQNGDLWRVGNDLKVRLNSTTEIVSTKTYVDQLLAAQDAMVFKGVVDCSSNPNYPAADRGWAYRVSVAGKIGGGSGVNVEAGDLLLCITDGTVTGTHAAVGANWSITQTNLDGAVIGPSSATSNDLAQFDGTTGKLIKGGISLDTDTTFTADSDTRVPTQKAIKAYAFGLADENQSISGGARIVSKNLGTISSGTLTLDPGNRPHQHYTNDGAHTLAAGTNVGSLLLVIKMGASASTITMSGFTAALVTGDLFTYNNGDEFWCWITIAESGKASAYIKAAQ